MNTIITIALIIMMAGVLPVVVILIASEKNKGEDSAR